MVQGVHRERGLHSRVDRVADDPVGVHVFDGAEVELAFIGAVLGDVGQPDLVGGLGAELTLHEVVMNRWPGSTVQSTLLGEDRPDPFLGAQPCDTVLAGSIPRPGSSSAMNRYPNAGSSEWMSRAALIRCASSQSRCETGSLRHL